MARGWRATIDRIARAVAPRVYGPPVAPDVQRAFEVYCDALMGRAAPWLLAFFAAVSALWWPSDPIVFAEQPVARSVMSVARAVIVVSHLFWLTIGLRALRRHPARWGSVIAIGEAWMLGALVGLIGGLDTPWPYSIFVWPLTSVCLARPLAARAWRVALMGFGAMACWWVTSQTPLDHPDLAPMASFLGFCCLFATLIGHGLWLLLRANFVQRQLIETQRAGLEGFGRELERRVAAQRADLQGLTQRLHTLREEERAWMARELHDALGQELTGARYALDLARARLSGSDARLDRALVDVHGRLGLAHESVRTILHRLRPRALDELGLAAALSWLADGLAARTGLAVTVVAQRSGVRLPAAYETALYRIATEALDNVVRHAAATRVEVALAVEGGRCVLTVRDDGVGLDADAAPTTGAGCIGIRERIGALGGQARWRALATGGTEVWVEAPIEGRG